MKKMLFIMNPYAGTRKANRYLADIISIFNRAGYEVSAYMTAGQGDATRMVEERAKDMDMVVCCGGDGTLNEVVDGAAGFDNAAVTVFSGGSGNDFTKLFSDPAAFRDIDRLLDSEEVTFDLIRCNGDIALNICSVGLDARIGTDVANYKRIPLLSGFRAYAVSTVFNVIKKIAEPYEIHINGEVINGKKTMVCVCNGRFYGGGFNPVPEADPTDGLLDVLVVEKVSRLKVAQVVAKYKKGRYADYPKLIRHFRTDRVKISCQQEVRINLDGELRTGKEIAFSVAEKKLRFFYPKELTYKTQ